MWRRVLFPVKAVVLGLVVAGVPTLVWAALAGVNFKWTPRVPWSAPVMLGVLWLIWRYLGGAWLPRRTSSFRHEHLRATALTPDTWRLALLAGGSAVAAVWAAFSALRGVLHLTAPAADVTRFPLLTIVASILIGSAVAGVIEEAGFRGYMQLPLERAYGPVVAIAITSVLFTLVHLTHGAPVLPFLPFYFVVAIAYGALTYFTGSILPSITLHMTGDILMLGLRFIALREGVAGNVANGSISFGAAVVSIVFAIASLAFFRDLARRTHAVSSTQSLPAAA